MAKLNYGSASRILTEELQDLRDRVALNIISEGANASGKTIESLEEEVTYADGRWHGVLYGRPFFGVLETGASAWRRREEYKHAPRWFAEIIQEWIDAKGLTLNAYAVAYNIIHQGTELKRRGGRDTIYSREIPQTLDKVAERFAAFFQTIAIEHIKLNSK